MAFPRRCFVGRVFGCPRMAGFGCAPRIMQISAISLARKTRQARFGEEWRARPHNFDYRVATNSFMA